MAFEKQYADIPDCSRVNYPYSDYNSAAILANLPKSAQNDGKDTERRKWELIGPGGSDVDWPGMMDWLKAFPCQKMVRAHISLIPKNFSLPIHRDGFGIEGEKRKYFDYFNKTLRFHVVLKTTPDAFILSNGKFYHMGKDELWMLNNFQPHSAVNRSEVNDRYHVIFDVEPNAKTLELVGSGTHDLGISNQAWLNELDWRQSKAQARPQNTGQLRRGPDFFVMGDFSCGGRGLFSGLAAHKNITEPNPIKGALSPLSDLDDYLSHFPVKSLDEISGHLLPQLFFRTNQIKALSERLPKAQFVVVLPNPAERAMTKIKGQNVRLENVLKDEASPIMKRGHYVQHLRRWQKHYPAERFHIVLLDELRATPRQSLSSVLEFLGQSADLPELKKLKMKPRNTQINGPLSAYYRPWNNRLGKFLGRNLPW